MQISIEDVDVGTRLRGPDAAQVQALAISIAEVGLLCPITVSRREVIRAGIAQPGWGIVAGVHRLEACRSLGWNDIPAHEVTLGELQRQIAECDENLCGTKLSPAERALFTRRRKDAYEALHPETKNGANQYSRVPQLEEPSFATDTSRRTGQSRQTVERDASRGKRIDEAVLSEISGSAFDRGTNLDALAALPKAEQASALQRIREAPRTKPVPVPMNDIETEETWRLAMMRLWNRAPNEWRENFIEYVQAPVFDSTRFGAA